MTKKEFCHRSGEPYCPMYGEHDIKWAVTCTYREFGSRCPYYEEALEARYANRNIMLNDPHVDDLIFFKFDTGKRP